MPPLSRALGGRLFGSCLIRVHLVFPVLNSSLGLRGTLLLTAGISILGMALTFVLPEPARRSLEDMHASRPAVAPQPLRVADSA
jgi:hypothetical protein